MSLTNLPQWQALATHQQEISKTHLRKLFQQDSQRFQNFSLEAANLLLDYSKNIITDKTLDLLCQLAETVNLPEQIQQLFSGYSVNNTENSPALHPALRNPNSIPEIHDTLSKMASFAEQVRSGSWQGFSGKSITDIVNIGIGGSHLGPELTTEALANYATSKLKIHFVSNIDGILISQILDKLNPETTLFIISSKSFSTIETLTNAETAKHWFIEKTGQNAFQNHFVAITAKTNKALELGYVAENIFPIRDWVGGRYSIWSAIGLPVALAIGMDNFYELLAGAYAMDQHFSSAPFKQNMPVILGLLAVWYRNFFNTSAHAILPYDQSLRLLPNYLQQAQMESLGKQVCKDGTSVNYATGDIIFGGVGTDTQHSFFQLLHQGTAVIPADFIVPVLPHHKLANHHAILLANAFGQSKALMQGKTLAEVIAELHKNNLDEKEINRLAPHKVLPGNRPNNTILISKLTPHTLGALLALYEHKTFVQSAIWQINAFDQWGVEIGKQLAGNILPELISGNTAEDLDNSTVGLVNYYRNYRVSKA